MLNHNLCRLLTNVSNTVLICFKAAEAEGDALIGCTRVAVGLFTATLEDRCRDAVMWTIAVRAWSQLCTTC